MASYKLLQVVKGCYRLLRDFMDTNYFIISGQVINRITTLQVICNSITLRYPMLIAFMTVKTTIQELYYTHACMNIRQ